MGELFTFGSVAMARVPLLASGADGLQEEALLEEGLFMASRSAAESGGSYRGAVTRSAYAIRARSRTTPHGVWCGVAPAVLEGRDSVLRLGEGHRTVSVPSPLWLWAYADRMLDRPGVVPRLWLMTNNLLVRRGDRLEAEHPAAGGGQLGSIRRTELSEWLTAVCADGAQGAEVIRTVCDRYPGADAGAARSALVQMIRTGILLTDLLPRDLRNDPLAQLLAKLPEDLPERLPLVCLRRALRSADRYGPGSGRRIRLLRVARERADRLHPVDRPLTVDTLADGEFRLPEEVGRRAAEAAEVLWRIGHRKPPLGDWSARFAAAYGHQRAVPVLEAVDPAVGIGPPRAVDAVAAVSDHDEARERMLARLLAEAWKKDSPEVELTEELVERLARHGGLPPRTAEIHIRVVSGPAHDSFRLVVGHHSSQTAGSAAGRFASLLPLPDPLRPGAYGDGPAVAEIVCAPAAARSAGLAVETGYAPYRIPVGVPVRDGDLQLRELVIVSTGRGLVLWSLTLRRPVVPVLFSRITRDLLPAPARLLHLLGHAAERPWHTWSWRQAANFPSTPRIVYRDVVLTPQRWLLPDGLIAAAGRRAAWESHLADWLAEAHPPLPGHVVAEESDRHLPIRLDTAEHRELLRRTVLRGARTVAEAIGYDGDELPVAGPSGRHPLELVVSLYRTVGPPLERIDPRTAPRPRSEDLCVPGTEWLSVSLAVPARHQDTVIRRLIPAPPGVRMFWLRYWTPESGPHIRLRYRAAPGTLRLLAESLARWSADLAGQRLTGGRLHHEPYVRETQRYGGPAAIDAAENVFAADSALVRELLGHPDDSGRVVAAAVSAAAIARAFASPGAARGGPLDRADRRRREELRPAARAHVVTSRTAPLWDARQESLTVYRAVLPSGEIAERCASDLIHLHCNRLLGTDPGSERIVRSLATDLLHCDG
ncbi:hypothetical protein B7R87_20565 [Streptomyces tsukubensis]|uniref:Lantibiotic dehydratase n=3 Tax=Streptomyces TaxID=1883 RepID=A0A7G3UC63_STRT9|nr:hypothetical protein B7R87_20565 [Streptomyces tsukubensis]QKM67987.1 hypothetical protein STSU_013215 [Streptomyces tsukubensis NRRL18488]TAI44385.1 hypothetical protein EWI31_13010 [Streptomyces tsukubensis]